MAEQVPVSTRWVVVSFVVYLLCEVALGGVLAPLLSGFVSRPMAMRVEVLLMLGSFFVGGFVVGALSPTVRVLEPALGAAGAVMLTFVYALFMPMSFYRVPPERLLLGAALAFGVALAGADSGERAAARLGNRASRDYSGER
jgi:hypothetical protein